MADHPQPDRFAFLHIDLNSFFASVEQQLHPEFRNLPLAVVPTRADTTCCIAASYEAKALGIKTGTQVGEAKRICPSIVLIEGNHAVYAEYSHRIAQAVERCCPVAHTPSIDEMVCQLLGRECEPPRARAIALQIKQAIKDDVGETLRCSIGMAPNRYLAKIASDMQKPDGLIGLLPSQLPRSIAHLELRDLPGVGARTELRLNAKGITTMPQLLALDRPALHALWDSVWGDRLYHWLRGADTGDDGAPSPPARRNPSATPTSSPPNTAPPQAPGPSPTSSSTKPPCASAWNTSTPNPCPSPSVTRSPATRPPP